MTQQHPITPPPELVRKWMERTEYDEDTWFYESYIAERAAQWGADRQLEADAEWLDQNSLDAPHLTITPTGKGLVEAMRPKPPSLKEQALALVEQHEDGWRPSPKDWDTIRRALEALPDSIVVFPSQC
jgi:hypothetical protein